jgi:transposase InsO family protein
MTKKVVAMEAKLLAVFSSGLPVNVSALCAEMDISRQTFYKYRRRWEDEGPPGLVERSRRPHRSPGQMLPEVEDKIVWLRKELPVDNGAQTIAYHLARDPEVEVVPSVSAIHRALVRRGMVEPQPNKRPKSSYRRFEWPRPNDAWQIDATSWALSCGREVWIMDVLDDHSRVLTAARVADGPSAEAAWDALVHAVADWGLPARVISDNGLCFTGRLQGRQVDFERQLRALGIHHICSSPAHPQTCGKLERCHQTTKKWLGAVGLAETANQLQDQLDRWRDYYNTQRPHSALRGATPAQRWAASEPAGPGDPIPGPWRASQHTVSSCGNVGWGRWNIAVGSQRAAQRVLVIARDLHLAIHGQGGLIRELTIDPNRRYQPSGERQGPKPKNPLI